MTPAHLTVIGADEELGEAVVREALVRGLTVTATAADPSRIARITADLRILAADPRSAEDLHRAITRHRAIDGSDAVVLGIGPDTGNEPTMSRTEATIAAVRAMRRADVDRLVAASHADLGGPSMVPPRLRGPLVPLHRRLERGSLADMRRMEVLLESSGLRTTVLRSGRLVDLLGSKAYRLATPQEALASPLPREDLARAMVDQSLEKDSARGVYSVIPSAPS